MVTNELDFEKSPPPAFTADCIVGETEGWLVVEKPPGLLAHPSKPGCGITLWDRLRELLAFEIVCGGQVSIVNRLDRETSGLTLVAKTRQAASRLSQEMGRRRIAKEYLAIVRGWPAQEEWSVDAPILRQGERMPSPIHLKQTIHPEGAPAFTRFQVLNRFVRSDSENGRFSVVRAHPFTGRMHQIRVHLAHSGHSIVGDKIYGPEESAYLEFIQTGWTPYLARRLLLRRHALHSAALRLECTGELWKSPLPADLARFVSSSLP